MNVISIVFGDWSEDGHENNENFYFHSNVTLKELREIYFDTVERTSNISEICEQDEDNLITVENLKDLKLSDEYISTYFDGKRELEACGEDFKNLFVHWITYHNEKLILTDHKPEKEDFHFCGFDSKGRHIGGFGYGCYSE